mgnify:CR=1 FL=1
MAGILVVSSAEELPAALASANEYLRFLRKRFREPDKHAPLLGVWVGGRVDQYWSALVSCDVGVPCSQQHARGSSQCPGAGDHSWRLRESVSVSGSWTLYWLDYVVRSDQVPAVAGCRDPLRAIAEALSCCAVSPIRGAFFPVFGTSSCAESRLDLLRQLQEDFPGLVDGRWFLDSKTEGLTPGEMH